MAVFSNKEQRIGLNNHTFSMIVQGNSMNFHLENFVSVFCLRMYGQFNCFAALAREYRKSALYIHEQRYQETVVLGLSQGKPKKLEKTATNHLNLSSITGFLVKLL